MSKLAKFATITAIGFLAAGSALAEGGPKIGGNAEIGVKNMGKVSENVAAGVGQNSSATQDLLSVKSGEVGGNVKMEVSNMGKIEKNVAAGVGANSKACQSVGSIGGGC